MALRGSVGGTMGLLLGETLSGFSKAPPCSAGSQKLPPPHPQATGLKVKKPKNPPSLLTTVVLDLWFCSPINYFPGTPLGVCVGLVVGRVRGGEGGRAKGRGVCLQAPNPEVRGATARCFLEPQV